MGSCCDPGSSVADGAGAAVALVRGHSEGLQAHPPAHVAPNGAKQSRVDRHTPLAPHHPHPGNGEHVAQDVPLAQRFAWATRVAGSSAGVKGIPHTPLRHASAPMHGVALAQHGLPKIPQGRAATAGGSTGVGVGCGDAGAGTAMGAAGHPHAPKAPLLWQVCAPLTPPAQGHAMTEPGTHVETAGGARLHPRRVMATMSDLFIAR